VSKVHILVRLPEDVKVWLKKQADLNASNMSVEVVRSIRERMDKVGVTEKT
jgi:hypothetical protein